MTDEKRGRAKGELDMTKAMKINIEHMECEVPEGTTQIVYPAAHPGGTGVRFLDKDEYMLRCILVHSMNDGDNTPCMCGKFHCSCGEEAEPGTKMVLWNYWPDGWGFVTDEGDTHWPYLVCRECVVDQQKQYDASMEMRLAYGGVYTDA